MKQKMTGRAVIGGIFFLAQSLLIGCDQADGPYSQDRTRSFGEDDGNAMAQRKSGVMTLVEEVAPADFRIAREFPSRTTGVVVKRLDGTQQIIPEEKIPDIMEQAKTERGMGLGSVLTAGLLGFMMGHNSTLSPYAYKDDHLYQQSLLNRELFYKQQEEDDKRRGYSGYWSGGRYYSPNPRTSGGDRQWARSSTGSAKTGFFSRLSSGFRSLG